MASFEESLFPPMRRVTTMDAESLEVQRCLGDYEKISSFTHNMFVECLGITSSFRANAKTAKDQGVRGVIVESTSGVNRPQGIHREVTEDIDYAERDRMMELHTTMCMQSLPQANRENVTKEERRRTAFLEDEKRKVTILEDEKRNTSRIPVLTEKKRVPVENRGNCVRNTENSKILHRQGKKNSASSLPMPLIKLTSTFSTEQNYRRRFEERERKLHEKNFQNSVEQMQRRQRAMDAKRLWDEKAREKLVTEAEHIEPAPKRQKTDTSEPEQKAKKKKTKESNLSKLRRKVANVYRKRGLL
jgi:hypothetical protein